MFYSSSESVLDKNGRIKIVTEYLEEFSKENFDVVLHCNIDGALAIYPASKWKASLDKFLRNFDEDSPDDRRVRRNIYSFTKPMKVSGQGRVTIPVNFRQRCNLDDGSNVMLGGVGDYLEVWAMKKWQAITAV